MDLTQWGTLIGLNLLGLITPGPDIVLLTRIALRSRAKALAGVAGIVTGLVLWVSLTVLGAAALLTLYPALLGGIQVLGGAWLLWFGSRLLRSAREQRHADTPVGITDTVGSAAACYRQGLATNLSNPKAVLYFASIMAPLMPTHPSPALAVGLVMVILCSCFLGFSALVLLLSTEAMRSRFLGVGAWIDGISGAFFLIAGAILVVAGLRALLAV